MVAIFRPYLVNPVEPVGMAKVEMTDFDTMLAVSATETTDYVNVLAVMVGEIMGLVTI